ncbi:MAG: type secretion system minor pseudopilin GspI [Pseudomonadota bacterium]|jgi:general secretion pathway protein I
MEVLVALAVLAISLAAVSQSMNAQIQNVTYLRDKTLAHWIAMNKITELRLQAAFLPIGKSGGKSMMGNREWIWELNVSPTIDPDLRQLNVNIYLIENKDKKQLTFLTGFITKPSL